MGATLNLVMIAVMTYHFDLACFAGGPTLSSVG